jgi:hypothetical protein
MEKAEADSDVLDYAGLDRRCPELKAGWTDVRNAPVYIPVSRAGVFDEYLWKEKTAVDVFCEAVAARDDAKTRDSIIVVRQGFEDVYARYN